MRRWPTPFAIFSLEVERRVLIVTEPANYSPSAPVLAAGRSTMGELFRSRAAVRPDDIAVEDGKRRLTYGKLNERVNRLVQVLSGIGVAHGDRVGLLARNCLEYLEVELATAKLGAITAALNWRLAGEELSHCINLTTPKVLLAQDDFADGLAKLELCDHRTLFIGDYYEQALADASADEPAITVTPEDGLVILFTSGTTGLPKGAVVSHRAMIARAFAFTSELAIAPDEGFVAWAPFFHMASTDHALATLIRGGKVIVIDGFQADAMIDAARRERIGWFVLIPGMVEQFIAAIDKTEGFEPRSIRVCGAMADLVAPQQIAAVSKRLKAPYLNSFGATETGLPPATRHLIPMGEAPEALAKEQSSCCEIRLVDQDGNDVAEGEPGELAIKGPTLFSGYWNADEANAKDFRGGWFHMGDIFRRLPNGRLEFVDRAKYMIKSGGENVYPAEIERVLFAEPRVIEAAVVRAKDEKWGEAPVAFVCRSDATLSASDLMARCREALAGYKRPREIRFIEFDDFPRSTTGKVQRHQLEALLEDEE